MSNPKERRCYVCKIVQPISHFYSLKNAKRNGGNHYKCKTCVKVYVKEWRAKKPPNYGKIQKLKKHYGITFDEYERLRRFQSSVCAICFGTSKNKSLAVDHCHNSKRVRGLLCDSCNRGLGWFMDNPTLLRAAANYLKNR